jgi:hypothetical protein
MTFLSVDQTFLTAAATLTDKNIGVLGQLLGVPWEFLEML